MRTRFSVPTTVVGALAFEKVGIALIAGLVALLRPLFSNRSAERSDPDPRSS